MAWPPPGLEGRWDEFLALDLVARARAAWPREVNEARQAAYAAGIQARALVGRGGGDNAQPFADIPDLAERFRAGWDGQDRVEKGRRPDNQAAFDL